MRLPAITHPDRQSAARVSAFVVFVVILLCALTLVLQPIDILIRHLKDDAFYYFKVANNIALGSGSTFDGINKTNGYHPLWMLNLIPIYLVYPHSIFVALRAILLVVAVYHALAAATLYRIVAHRNGQGTGIVVALAWAANPITLRMNLSGMESALYAVCLTALMYQITAACKDAQGRWNLELQTNRDLLKLGCISAFCVLARLDSIYLVAGMLVTALVPRHLGLGGVLARVRAVIIVALPVVGLVGGYLASNVVLFGQLYPVSGRIKLPIMPASPAAFIAQLAWPLAPLSRSPYQLSAIGCVIGVCGVAGALRLRERHVRQSVARTFQHYDWLLLGVLPLYVHMSLSKTFIHSWYYVPFLLLVAVLAADLGRGVVTCLPPVTRVRSAVYACGVALCIASYTALGLVEFGPNKNDYVYKSYLSSLWVRDNLPAGAIGAAWNAGIIGYFSGRQVVNLDGLINSYDYYAALKAGRDPEFVISQGVSFVFDAFVVPDTGDTTGFMPFPQWAPYLTPYYEERYSAHNVGVSSYFTPVFPSHTHDALFMFKVWKVKPLTP